MAERNNSYKAGVLGGHGEDYQRNLALLLLTRATLGKRPFKLGIEMRDDAGKFDDVVLLDETSQEWWLIQTKHSMVQQSKVTAEALFPKTTGGVNGDFSIFKYFKSYLHVKQYWPHGGKRIRLFLFTNKEFDGSLDVENVEVDGMLQFANARHVKLRPKQEALRAIQDYINGDYELMCEKIVRLFAGDGVDPVLKKYKRPLSEVLIKSSNEVKFSESFNPNSPNWRLRQLYSSLETAFGLVNQDIATISVPLPKDMTDFWTVKSRDKETTLPLVDRATVERFFDHFVLSTSQPNGHELLNIINDEWRFWMRSWIRPDVLGKLSKEQLMLPVNSFKASFERWERRSQSEDVSEFLLLENGVQFLEIVEAKLSSTLSQFSSKSRSGFVSSAKFYVNRRISYTVRHDIPTSETSIGDVKQYREMSDSEFVKQLCEQFADQRCMVLTAEPGMGKTTLWQHLAFCVQQQNPEAFVVLLYLDDFSGILPEVNNLDEALNFIPISLSRKNTQLVKAGYQRVIIFMDAFDEVDSHNIPQILQLIRILEANENFKILISSRGRVREEIEKELGVESMLLVPLDGKDQQNFLKRFWDVREGTETTKFNEFVDKLRQKLFCGIPLNECDFLGFPITMKMIAEIYFDSFQQFLRFGKEAQTSRERLLNVELYDNFTTKCIVMQYKKKNKLEGDESKIIKTFQRQIEADKHRYQLLAMKVLIDDMTLEGVTDDRFETNLNTFMTEILEGQEESLLIETIDGAARFTHLSYAEFFAAKFLYKCIAKAAWKTFPQIPIKFLITSSTPTSKLSQNTIKILENNKSIRAFFLAMIDSQSHQNHLHLLDHIDHRVAFWSCENNCCNLIKYLQKSHNFGAIRWTEENSMIHVAVESNAFEALQFLLENPAGINARNANLDTPLIGASRCGNLDAVKLLIEKGADLSLLGHLHRTPLYVAASAGHAAIVEYLLQKFAYVNCRTKVLRETPLHRAAAHGKLDVVELLIAAGAEVNSLDNDRHAPLLNATRGGHTEVVQCLMDHSANHELCDKNGWSPLHHAAKNGFTDIVTILIAKRVDVNPVEHNGATPLHIAAHFGHTLIVQKLIASSAEIFCRNRRGLTPLHCAAEQGFPKVMDLLISRGSNVNSVDSIGRTPLHCASQGGHTEVVRQLVELSSKVSTVDLSDALDDIRFLFSGRARTKLRTPTAWYFINQSAEINCRDKDGRTPLHYAAEKGFRKIVVLLVSAGADVKAVDCNGKTPLNLADRSGHEDTVKYLRNSPATHDRKSGEFLHYAAGEREIAQYLSVGGASSSSVDPNRKSPLHRAAQQGHTKTGRNLLTGDGVKATVRDNTGKTPLHLASWEGSTETVQQLLAARANVNATDNDSTTALHLAAKFGRTEVIKTLLENSASIDCRDEDGWTPLHYAADKGHSRTVKLLIATGADVNLTEELGCTPLHRAAYTGHAETVRHLIAHTSNLNQKDVWGQTPLHYAAWNGLRDIVELLVDSGADPRTVSDQRLSALDYAEADSSVYEYLVMKLRSSSE